MVGTTAEANMNDTVLTALPRVMSRFNFKLVPVDAAFTRGRWRCWDYADAGVLLAGRATGLPPPVLNRSDMLHFNEPGDNASELHSPAAVACMSLGHDDRANAPLSPIMDELLAASESPAVGESKGSSPATGGGGSTGAPNIDSKIEQAMDLVKTHLMYAVREEVETLRLRIADLELVALLEPVKCPVEWKVSSKVSKVM